MEKEFPFKIPPVEPEERPLHPHSLKIPQEKSTPRLVTIILIIIAFLAGIAFIEYLTYCNYSKKAFLDKILPTPVCSQPTPTPIPTTDPTADWKTYNDNKYSFSFKYPDNWIFGEDNSFNNRKGENIYLRPADMVPSESTYGEVNIWIFKWTSTLNEFIDSELCNESGRCNSSNSAESIKLGGINAKKIMDNGGPLPSDIILVQKNNSIIEFDFNYNGENRDNFSNHESKNVFYQILSTFKFTD